jgi:hypothetical protein
MAATAEAEAVLDSPLPIQLGLLLLTLLVVRVVSLEETAVRKRDMALLQAKVEMVHTEFLMCLLLAMALVV